MIPNQYFLSVSGLGTKHLKTKRRLRKRRMPNVERKKRRKRVIFTNSEFFFNFFKETDSFTLQSLLQDTNSFVIVQCGRTLNIFDHDPHLNSLSNPTWPYVITVIP